MSDGTFWENCFPRLIWSAQDAGRRIIGKRTVVTAGDAGPEVWVVTDIRIDRDGDGVSYKKDWRLR